jgi:ribosome maturation factor RimP
LICFPFHDSFTAIPLFVKWASARFFYWWRRWKTEAKQVAARQDIEERVHRLVEELVRGSDLEPVEARFTREGRQSYLRIFIHRDEGVTLTHCQELSERLDLALEVEDFIPDAYILEVSSPGLNRPLRTPRDFERNIGRLARISTTEVLDDRKRFLGRIQEVDDRELTLEGSKSTWRIPLESIAKAKLEIEFR